MIKAIQWGNYWIKALTRAESKGKRCCVKIEMDETPVVCKEPAAVNNDVAGRGNNHMCAGHYRQWARLVPKKERGAPPTLEELRELIGWGKK